MKHVLVNEFFYQRVYEMKNFRINEKVSIIELQNKNIIIDETFSLMIL